MELRGKVALVTGASSVGGIGFQIARCLVSEGACVTLTGRSTSRGELAASALGGETRFVRADLSNLDHVRALASEAGNVDILVNNAGAWMFGSAIEQGVESFDAVLAANVRGPFFLTQAVAPRMKARGGGAIVNVASAVARIGQPDMSVYSLTKAALESLTRSWAAEFAGASIRVNAVSPGPTRSEKVLPFMDVIDGMAKQTMLGRVAETSEIAEVVAFLAGPRSSYVTGACFAVDGGRTAA